MGALKPLIALCAVVVLLIAGAGALSAANADAERGAGEQRLVSGEPFSGATSGYDVAVGTNSDTYSATHEIVVRDGGGAELSPKEYDWNPETGTLRTASTSSGTINYSVYRPSQSTSGIFQIATLPIEAGQGIVYLLFVFVIAGAFLLVKEVAM